MITKLALLAMLLPATGLCQSLGYMDADTPGQALGMMKSTMQLAQVLREHCVARFPVLRDEIDSNLSKWRATEAKVLAKVDAHWPQAVEQEPKLGEMVVQIDTIVKNNLDAISRIQAPDGKAGSDLVAAYCRQHFADLASGIWRKRTPRAYVYMDRAPD